MTENFNYIFQYLEKEQINIDKPEFLFQIQSHPNYPSLLSIADTLSFFNVDNGVLRAEVSDLESLPEHFVAFLNEEMSTPQLFFIERKNNNFLFTKNKKMLEISKSELESRWKNIVLLVQKTKNEEILKKTKTAWSWVLKLFVLLFLLLVFFQFETDFATKLFLAFPLIGTLFSVAALKDLFGTKNELLNSFCNMTASTSCTTVVASTNWKFFEIVNLSDLSIIFFASQFMSLLIFLFSGDTFTYFSIQKIMLLGSIPVLFLSIYYQKFVEKKWCPICLVIISIILLELSYLFLFQNILLSFSTKSIIVFGFVFFLTILIWSVLKELLIEQKDLKEYQLKAIRFERNYDLFKNSLLAKNKVQLPETPFILGNKKSKTIITIISSPFCSHCKDAHKIMDNILAKHMNDLQIQVILQTNIEAENEENRKLFRSLMEIYNQNGATAFIKSLQNWFDNKNMIEWFSLFPINTTTENDAIFINQYKWTEENDYNFTPAIFVNGYEFPKVYNRETLQFFVNDLLEDEF